MKKIFFLLFSCYLAQISSIAQTKENTDALPIPELPNTIPDIHDLFSFVYNENDSLKIEIATLKTVQAGLRKDLSEQKHQFDMLSRKYDNFPDKKTMELRIEQYVQNELNLNASIASIAAELNELKNNQPSLILSEFNKGKDAVIQELEGYFKSKSIDDIISSTSFSSCNFYKAFFGTRATDNTKLVLNILYTYYEAEEKLKNKCSEEEFARIELNLKGLNVDSQNVRDLINVLENRKSMAEDLIAILQEIQVINKNQVANDVNTAKIKRMKLYERLEFFCYNHDYLNEKWPYLNSYLREVRKRISESENTGYNVDVSDIIIELKK